MGDEAGLVPADASRAAGLRQIRAGEARGEQVKTTREVAELTNVWVNLHSGKAIPEHSLGRCPGLAEEIRLDGRAECPVEPELDATDARKQARDPH